MSDEHETTELEVVNSNPVSDRQLLDAQWAFVGQVVNEVPMWAWDIEGDSSNNGLVEAVRAMRVKCTELERDLAAAREREGRMRDLLKEAVKNEPCKCWLYEQYLDQRKCLECRVRAELAAPDAEGAGDAGE